MYLQAAKYAPAYEHNSDQERGAVRATLNALGFVPEDLCKHSPSIQLHLTVAYWRKANAIHGWFVTHCQEGRDECQTTYVDRKQLETLLALARKVRDTKDASLLPPVGGFFFGSTAVDEGYWDDIASTITQLEAILLNPRFNRSVDFYYRASW